MATLILKGTLQRFLPLDNFVTTFFTFLRARMKSRHSAPLADIVTPQAPRYLPILEQLVVASAFHTYCGEHSIGISVCNVAMYIISVDNAGS